MRTNAERIATALFALSLIAGTITTAQKHLGTP